MEERCKKLVADIQGLSQVETEEIFKIIHKSNCDYTKNNNGIFVNLAWLPEDSITKLEEYVKFCNQSKQELTKYESLCDVLNHKMYEYNEDDTEHIAASQVKLVKEKEKEKEAITDEDKHSPKVSSSLRYYLLKKRYSKQQTPSTNMINHLSKEKVIL